MGWLETTREVLSMIVALVGVIGSLISSILAIKATIEKNRIKTLADMWSIIMALTDEAMKVAESSGKKGEQKKQMVMYAVITAAKASNINIMPFSEQLGEYIDQTIQFVKEMKHHELL
jgi:hypothetical protein